MSNNYPMTLSAAQELFLSGDLDNAALVCGRIITQQPGNTEVLHLYGQILLRKGDPFGADYLIRQSISLRPGDANAHVNLGRSLYQQSKLQEAVSEYRKAIKIQKNLPDVRALLESTRSEIKQLDETARLLEKTGQSPSISFTEKEKNSHFPNQATLNRAIWLYKYFGYLVLDDVFSEMFVNTLYENYESEYFRYIDDTPDKDNLDIVGDKRFNLTLQLNGAFNTPEYYANSLIMPIVERLLGRDCILLSLGSYASLPGAQAQHMHRDHDDLFEAEFTDENMPSFAVTLGTPLIEMNESNGTTRVYGKTHKNQNLLAIKDHKKGINPLIKKGSCFLFDYRILHEGTPNNSNNVRPLMCTVYSRPWFRDNKYTILSVLNIEDDEFSKIPNEHRKLFKWSRYGQKDGDA